MSIFQSTASGVMSSRDGAVPEINYNPLPCGSVVPEGWLREQMRLDLESGLAGSYERIWPNVSMNLFVKQERTPGMVNVRHGEEISEQRAWWAGEHEGYWKDAIVRLAYLTDNQQFKERIVQWMNEILESAEAHDGYIGIYDPESRFPKEGPDGELWTQSRIFQAMLAYYEFTGNGNILQAVERAATLTVSEYKNVQGTYFGRPKCNEDGGVTHGLAFADTLEWLYRLTGKTEYRDGVVWLYDDYSTHESWANHDLQLEHLLDAERRFKKHTPHIVEALYLPRICALVTGKEPYAQASANLDEKLAYHTTPGGHIVGDEWVHEVMGTGDVRGEYCSMMEIIPSFTKLIAWDGSLHPAELIERTAYNAAQAARFHPVNKAVQYLGIDNQYSASDRELNGGRTVYAGYHKAAACCTLNSTRLWPYMIDGMWYETTDTPGLIAMLYGPSKLEYQIRDKQVVITEETQYPFEDTVRLTVDPSSPTQLLLRFRIPEGAGDVGVDVPEGARWGMENGYVWVDHTWTKGNTVVLDFNFHPKIHMDQDGTAFVGWGPLLFSLPIPADIKRVGELTLVDGIKSGFFEYAITPLTGGETWDMLLPADAEILVNKHTEVNFLHPWSNPPISLIVTLINGDGEKKRVKFLPHGSLRLRRLTFPVVPD